MFNIQTKAKQRRRSAQRADPTPEDDADREELLRGDRDRHLVLIVSSGGRRDLADGDVDG